MTELATTNSGPTIRQTVTVLPFAEAIDLAKRRKVVLPDVYYGELIGEARQTSFSVAGLASIAQLTQVLDSLNEAMKEGLSFNDWKDKTLEEQDLGLSDARLETIFRTNVQSSYMRGHYRQQALTALTRPFLMYDAVNDARTRPNHAAMDGYIAHFDDPIWHTHRPPMGYNCRCTLISLTPEQASARGYDGGAAPTVEPDEGWDYDKLDHTRGIDAALKNALENARSPLLAKELAQLKEPGSATNPYAGRVKNLDEAKKVGAEIANEIDAIYKERNPDWIPGSQHTSLEYRDALQEWMKRNGIESGDGYDVGRLLEGFAHQRSTEELSHLAKYLPKSLLDNLAAAGDADGKWLSAIYDPSARGVYRPGSQELVFDSRSPFVHEFFHHVQAKNPGYDDIFQQLHGERTSLDSLRKLSDLTGNQNYESWEVAREDKYPTPYWGKEYNFTNTRHGALEVTAMANEALLGGDPVKLRGITLANQRDIWHTTLGALYGYDF